MKDEINTNKDETDIDDDENENENHIVNDFSDGLVYFLVECTLN